MRKLTIAAAMLAALAAMPAQAADAAKGEKVFKKCKACHQVGDGAKNKVGPVLTGFLGRNLAGVEDFKYSKVFKENADKVWTEELFLEFVTKPKALFKGTKMAFAGLKKEDQRADLLAWLKENGACPADGCPPATN